MPDRKGRPPLDETQPPEADKWNNRPYACRKVVDGEVRTCRGDERHSAHDFVEDKLLRSNEEMFLIKDDDEIYPGEWITPEIEALDAKCCRGIFHQDKHQFAEKLRVHGEGLKVFSGTQGGDPDLGIPPDPKYGWDMQNRAEGFPCIALKEGKCTYHKGNVTQTGKPIACAMFPINPLALHLITTCSYTFDDKGKRSGSCNGCGSLGS